MRIAVNRNSEPATVKRRFGSEIEVEAITGYSRRTLQKDRLLRRKRFPHYKLGRKVLYDLDECIAIIQAARIAPEPEAA